DGRASGARRSTSGCDTPWIVARGPRRLAVTVCTLAGNSAVGFPHLSGRGAQMKVLARVLLGLGSFLLIAGILALTYAPGVVKKTPLDVDTTTVYEGQAAKIDPLTGAFDTKPVY